MKTKISILIPLFNEQDTCTELIKRLDTVCDNNNSYDFEYLFVDDGSSDNTFDKIKDISQVNKRITIISLSRNFGHQAALTAAIDNMNGSIAIIMDGDLQDPPEVIPQFLEHYQKGFDVVYAKRASRKESWHLRICYYLFYRLLGKISSSPIPLDSGDFSLLSSRVLNVIRASKERHRFLRGLRAWSGFKQASIEIQRGERFAGDSKYTLRKLLALAFDGIFSFSIAPLRIAAFIGFLTVVASSIFLIYSIYIKVVLNDPPTGFTALIVSILFTAGLQLMFLGIIGEYVGRIYEETKARPHYVIDKIIRSNKNQ
jgi:polyisoprenyl-phosphate glycosyltransferase